MNAKTRRWWFGHLPHGAAAAAPAHAQGDYPNRTIRIVVGFAAGGGNDIFARLVGQKLQELIGQTVIIENKPGAGARLANEYAANQPADGYTLLVAASGGMSIASAIYPKLGYHPTKSFVPLTMIASFPLILAIPATHPAKTIPELVAWMKANPDKSNYATSSPAFTIATELFKLKTGAPGQAIPYKSSGESLVSVIGGQTLLTIADGPPTVPLVKGGQARALAVTGSVRSAELPDVPTHDGSGTARGQHQPVERRICARRNSAGDRQETRGHAAPRDRRSGRERQAACHGGQSRRRVVRGIPCDDRCRYQDHG